MKNIGPDLLIRYRSEVQLYKLGRVLGKASITLFLLSTAALSQNAPVERFKVSVSREKITVDGNLDENAWKNSPVYELEYQVSPGDNVEPSVKTEVKLLEDENFLYVGFIAWDPQISKIRSFFRERDNASDDDRVGIEIDTFNDHTRAYQFSATPSKAQIDSIIDGRSGKSDFSWTGSWIVHSTKSQNAYIVEMAIPLTDLNYLKEKELQIWAINFTRYRSLTNEFISFARLSRERSCELCQFQKFELFENIKGQSHLEITPALVSTYSKRRADEGQEGPDESRGFDEAQENQVGADIRWTINASDTINATINPDFSQIEADELQLQVNSNFALFFEEKRLFFLENLDYLESPIDLIYTRNVIEPKFGLKYSGQGIDSTKTLIVVDDEQTSFVLPSFEGSEVYLLPRKSVNTIARYQRNLGENNSIGVSLTNRTAKDYNNTAISLDGNLIASERHETNFQIVATETKNPNELLDEFNNPDDGFDEPLIDPINEVNPDILDNEVTSDDNQGARRFSKRQDDYAALIRYNYVSEKWGLQAMYSYFGEDFRSDLGFIPQVNFSSKSLAGNYRWQVLNNTLVSDLGMQVEFSSTTRTDGQRLSNFASAGFDLGKGRFYNFAIRANQGEQFYNGIIYDLTNYSSSIELNPAANLRLMLELSGGDEVDLENARPGNLLSFQQSLTWNLNDHLSLDFSYSSETLSVEEGEVFSARALSLFARYQFSNKTFIRTSFQMGCVENNPELFEDPSEIEGELCDRSSQFLFSHEIQPRATISIAYADSQFRDNKLDRYRLNDKSIIMKISYTWGLY